MRYYWLQDRQSQKQIRVFWATKHTNLADYFTKRHPETHHVQIRPFIISENTDNPKYLSLTDLPNQPNAMDPEPLPSFSKTQDTQVSQQSFHQAERVC